MAGQGDVQGQQPTSLGLLSDTGFRTDAHAVIIGIDRYKDPAIPRLRFARADAEAVYAVLTDPAIGHFTREQVTLLLDEDATERGIKRAISVQLSHRAGPDDTVCVYYAGHGAPVIDPRSRAKDGMEKYLVPHDADADDLRSSAISMEALSQWFDWIHARQVVFFIDSCYSGGAGGRSFDIPGFQRRAASLSDEFLDALGAEGRYVVTACAANEISLETSELGHGIFTHRLIEGLKGAAADDNGFVTLDALYNYVFRTVSSDARMLGGSMRPIRKGSAQGTLFLTKHETKQQRRVREMSSAASAALELNDVALATRLYRDILAQDPTNPAATRTIATLKEQAARRRDQLLHHFNKKAISPPELAEALFLLGQELAQLSAPERVKREFAEHLADTTINPEQYCAIMRALLETTGSRISAPNLLQSGSLVSPPVALERPERERTDRGTARLAAAQKHSTPPSPDDQSRRASDEKGVAKTSTADHPTTPNPTSSPPAIATSKRPLTFTEGARHRDKANVKTNSRVLGSLPLPVLSEPYAFAVLVSIFAALEAGLWVSLRRFAAVQGSTVTWHALLGTVLILSGYMLGVVAAVVAGDKVRWNGRIDAAIASGGVLAVFSLIATVLGVGVSIAALVAECTATIVFVAALFALIGTLASWSPRRRVSVGSAGGGICGALFSLLLQHGFANERLTTSYYVETGVVLGTFVGVLASLWYPCSVVVAGAHVTTSSASAARTTAARIRTLSGADSFDSDSTFYVQMLAVGALLVALLFVETMGRLKDSFILRNSVLSDTAVVLPVYPEYTASQVAKPASIVSAPTQLYPVSLFREHRSGEVRLSFVVDTSGTVYTATVHVLSTDNDELTGEARAILPSSRFTPAELGGRVVRRVYEQPMTFELRAISPTQVDTPAGATLTSLTSAVFRLRVPEA